VPTEAETPVLARSLNFRRAIRGFVLFGPLKNGIPSDPDEIKLSELLAKNAGTAYAVVEGNEARLRLAKFETQARVTVS